MTIRILAKVIHLIDVAVDCMQTVITTRHNKAAYLAPILKSVGIELEAYEGFDTDTLGTFCQLTQRKASPEECALIKAKIACEATGAQHGLGSEGSFGGGPYSSFFNWNQEVLCFYQRDPEQVIYAYAEGPVGLESITFSDSDALQGWVKRFPGQYWVVQQQDSVLKGLTSEALLTLANDGELQPGGIISPDLRAMYCPTRQILLEEVAKDLCVRLQSLCPACQAKDFVIKQREPGLPCRICKTPTSKIKYNISVCSQCGHQQNHAPADFADPFYCSSCNP